MDSKERKNLSCYCISLRRAAKTITQYYDSIMKPTGISITQYSILSNINKHENCTTTDLANYMALDRTTLVRTLNPLFDKQLVQDISNKNERNRKLQLTKEGKDTYKKAKILWNEAQETIKQRLSEEELKTLNNIIEKLQK